MPRDTWGMLRTSFGFFFFAFFFFWTSESGFVRCPVSGGLIVRSTLLALGTAASTAVRLRGAESGAVRVGKRFPWLGTVIPLQAPGEGLRLRCFSRPFPRGVCREPGLGSSRGAGVPSAAQVLGYDFVSLFGEMDSPGTFTETAAFEWWFVQVWEFSRKADSLRSVSRAEVFSARSEQGRALQRFQERDGESVAGHPVPQGVRPSPPRFRWSTQLEQLGPAVWSQVLPQDRTKAKVHVQCVHLVALGGGHCPQQLP